MRKPTVYTERTNLRTILVATIVFLLGLVLILLAEFMFISVPLLQVLSRDLGSLLVASVAIALLWELFSRRALLAELLAATRLVDDIETVGLQTVSAKWQGQVDWPTLFNSSNSVSIFFMYGRTWRNTYLDNLNRFARRARSKAIVVLPDPEDAALMAHLAKRIGLTSEEMVSRITETTRALKDCFSPDAGALASLSIWYAPVAPVFSYYCFDNSAVFTLYKHSIEKVEVPTFSVRRGGSLFEFLEKDFHSLVHGPSPLARCVYTSLQT